MLQIVRKVSQEQGIFAFFRGNLPNVYRNVAQAALRVSLYDIIKEGLIPQGESEYSGVELLGRRTVSAYACGLLICAATYPLDLIHTRFAADHSRWKTPKAYASTLDCFRKCSAEAGLRGPFRGVGIAMLSVAPYTAVN